MRFRTTCLLSCGFAALGWHTAGAQEFFFNRVATLPNYSVNADDGDETVSEIVAATVDGNTLVYSDSELEEVGFVDITVPGSPQALGKFGVDGSPTSVAVLDNTYALVGVDTSDSFTDPSGFLAVLDITSLPIVTLAATIDLGGQPDSISISPDGLFAAVAIENQRDEFICVGGTQDASPVPEDGPEAPGDITEDECEAGGGQVGVVPQNGPETSIGNPAGYLAVIDLTDADPTNWVRSDVDLTGLADFAATDPETEFVDINALNQAVVTLQENNHIVIVDLTDGSIVADFSAGDVDLFDIDANEDGVIALADDLVGVPREPDAVAWIALGGDDYALATANEGDLFGGSRGITVFDTEGNVIFDSASTFEETAVQNGHYPEARSENKGTEPEAIEFATIDGVSYLLAGSERGGFITVYTLDALGVPTFSQLLPGPLEPEGLLAIADRGLLVASGEADDPTFGVRSTIMIYERQELAASYPQILSDVAGGSPMPWSALSGMVGVPGSDDELLAVWDSYYSQSQILTIDVTQAPAVITNALPVQGGSGDYDPEGIVVSPDGGSYWIASEGDAEERVNRLLQVDLTGNVIDEVSLPQRTEVCRGKSASTGSLASGFEGLTVVEPPLPGITSPGKSASYFLLVAQQRGWNYTTPSCQAIDDDAFDLTADEPGVTRIWVYDVKRHSWDHIVYELEPVPADASWVGLSEITRVEDGFVVIERDNRTGDFAELKWLAYFPDAAIADGIVTRAEKTAYDLIPDLQATNGWITDKPEGVAVTPNGELYVVTDNDGVEDWSGETWFLRLGEWSELFD